MQAFFGGDPQASFLGHRDEIAKVSKLHERYLRSIALSLQSLFQRCQPIAKRGPRGRERELVDGERDTPYERGCAANDAGVPPMATKRVINGVHVVPMGMANAFLIESDDGLT